MTLTNLQQKLICFLASNPRSTRREMAKHFYYSYSHVWQVMREIRGYVTEHRDCYPVEYSARKALNWDPRKEEVLPE